MILKDGVRYDREWRRHKEKQRWLTRVPERDVTQAGTSEQATYYCWQPLASEMVIRQMTIGCADLDNTPTTYHLSASTLNVNNNSSSIDSSSSSSNSNTCSAAAVDEVDPPNCADRTHSSATCDRCQNHLHTTGRLFNAANWSSIGESQQMTVRKPESKACDFTVPLVTTAPTSVSTASVSSSTGTSSADTMTIATTIVPSSSSQPAAFT
ncbi:CCR4-NOT transcription complex subunit 2 [Taenia solium]|eukprot:TsM_001234500 transcript=TsM_001234500 gene=TsM_001234500